MNKLGPRHALILAAGKGTRFKSEKPKVLHEVCGKPMITYLLDRLPLLGVDRTFVVVGQGADQVRSALQGYDVEYVTQDKQLGTGHAVKVAIPQIAHLTGSLIVLYGDTPLIGTDALTALFEARESGDADEALLTVELEVPTGYGRIIRDTEGRIVDIIEEKEATPEQKRLKEINPGFVCFKITSLVETIEDLRNENNTGEYYLTDMVKVLRRRNRRVETKLVEAADEILGINSRRELVTAERKLRGDIARRWIEEGVTILDPASVILDATVEFEPDCTVYPGVIIEGRSKIGRGSTIYAHSHLRNAVLGQEVVIDHCSVVRESEVKSHSQIGPFAHLRGGSVVGESNRIGNFVELKATTLETNCKASHLSYLGDTHVGRDVNVGAGTITCNYDGYAKHPTVIEEGAFIGSDCQLVAPVRIGKGSVVAAGSTITADVPPGAMGIARCRQNNKENWAEQRRAEREKRDKRK